MFIEVETTRNEPVLLNISQILYVTKAKKNTILVDINGCDYVLKDTYESIIDRLSKDTKSNVLTKCINQVVNNI